MNNWRSMESLDDLPSNTCISACRSPSPNSVRYCIELNEQLKTHCCKPPDIHVDLSHRKKRPKDVKFL